jgi:hypothetical protein
MHFSRSLAGLALLGVFAAMAFAGAATGAPAQTSATTPLEGALSGTKFQAQKLGRTGAIAPGAAKAVEKNPYQAVLQANAKGEMLATSVNRSVPKAQTSAALSYKAPSSLNATAAATADQPVTFKHPSVLSKAGVNAWQQETFGGYNLEPPDPSLCAGQGFVVQVVNSQIQISDGNLNKLTAPISMESFFGDFVNILFDPLCSYNHSTGRFYLTEAVTDFATFSGVYIAVSTSSDPRSVWNIYYLDLGNFGGDDPDTIAVEGCGNDLCLADQPNLGSDQYTISISTNQFDMDGDLVECASGFCGAVYVLIDKVALALGSPFPNVVGYDLGASPDISPDFDFGNCINSPIGPCWYSIQPADAANGRYDTRSGGTTWALSSLDFFGLSDNRVGLWRFANTQSIGAFVPSIAASVGVLHFTGHGYSSPGLAAQPQNPTSPVQANGNPLGDFLVLVGACPAGTPPAGCSNPGPIASRDDRMRDTMMTTIGTCNPPHSSCSRVMWGGLSTAAEGGSRQGIMLFGVNLGSSIVTSSLGRVWTIHNPSNDVHYPAVSIFDNGQALASYGVSGPSLYPSAAYSTFTMGSAPAAIQISNQGLGVQDGFTQYTVFTGSYRPRWGDYSGAATMGNSIYFTTEYIPDANCSLQQFIADDTCGPSTGHPFQQNISPRVENANKRTFFANWGTSLNRATTTAHHP